MQELFNKRTYNAKHIDNGDGTFTMNAHVGHIHYKENGVFFDSDIHFRDETDRWVMDKHNYHLTIFKNFAAPELIRFENHYEGANHAIIYEPHSLVWFRKSNKDVQPYRTQQNVQGVCNTENNSIYYTNAFGDGIDFEITLRRSGFTKEVVIPNKPAQAPTPPSPNHKLYALFKYNGEGLRVKKPSGTEWNGVELFDGLDGFEIEEQAQPLAKSFIRKAYLKDSIDEATGHLRPTKIELDVVWFLRNGSLWQAKEIPIEKIINNGNFPVRFDTATDYYASATGDGYTGVESGSLGSWSATVSANGNVAGSADTFSYGFIADHHTVDQWRNDFPQFPIDTSGLGSSAVVSAATMYVYITAKLSGTGQFWTLTESGQQSASSCQTSDYQNRSRLVKSSQSFNVATVTTSAYNSVSYTDLTIINKTGTTFVSFVADDDVNNTDPGGGTTGSQNALQLRYADYTGTSSDPYLTVTYSVSTGPAKLKTKNTIAKASVKTIDTIAIASVKTIDTIGS